MRVPFHTSSIAPAFHWGPQRNLKSCGGESGGMRRLYAASGIRCDRIAEREASMLGVFMRRPDYPDFLKYHTAIALKSAFRRKISLSRTFLPSRFAKVNFFL